MKVRPWRRWVEEEEGGLCASVTGTDPSTTTYTWASLLPLPLLVRPGQYPDQMVGPQHLEDHILTVSQVRWRNVLPQVTDGRQCLNT